MSIADGWMPDVLHVPTAAHGHPAVPTGQMWPKQIVHHVMQGYQHTMIQWANQRPPIVKASAHFTVDRNGRIMQHVSIWDPAWHVAHQDWNVHSVGIEQEGFSIAAPLGAYAYSPENPWPEPLIQAVIRINLWVMDAIRIYDQTVVPGPDTIITHALTGQPDRIHDPGQLWMDTVWPRILAAFAPQPDPEYLRGVKDGTNATLNRFQDLVNEMRAA